MGRLVRTLSVDIDGTVADIGARVRRAATVAQEGSVQYWDALLDGDWYHLDRPIREAREFLLGWTQEGGSVVYLSGRRAGTEEATRSWLETHEFPTGRVIHRMKGRDSRTFKTTELRELKKHTRLAGHVGDRLLDDGGAARNAGVRFYHVRENEGASWPKLRAVLGASR